ncbi:MFS family permease [Actinoplanes octamycinicus]|uniref:MFS family permease n=1 Tax=Actinoplanes octamycinicus TaxID=135948 RepID=A0A7W7GWW6_9ACTN|nr:MFS transporter [Actinoplanes octamycinicus]MBB4739776.1 MFS family permease [Actinoplanes octamycinicus]GIE54959.1 hypothetical protein Aoc01nite_03610 [Actinoplanes octamycinicus]
MRRNAVLFVLISLFSGFGSYALGLAAGLWILDLTGSAGLAALAGIGVYAPTLAAPWLGALVDRFPRRPLLITVDVLVGAAILTLLIAPSAVWIYPILLVRGFSYVLLDAGETALLPAALPPASLGDVNGWRSSAQEGMKLLAPLAGAALYAWRGPHAVVLLCAVLPLLTAGLYALVQLRPLAVPAAAPSRRAQVTGQPSESGYGRDDAAPGRPERGGRQATTHQSAMDPTATAPEDQLTAHQIGATTPGDQDAAWQLGTTVPGDRHTAPQDGMTRPGDRHTAPHVGATNPEDRHAAPQVRAMDPENRHAPSKSGPPPAASQAVASEATTVPAPEQPTASEQGKPTLGWSSVRAGIAALGQEPLRTPVLLAAVAIAVSGLTNAAVLLHLVDGLHRPATHLGILSSVQGAGSILGGFLVGRLLAHLPPARVAALGAALFAAACVAWSLPWWPAMLVGSALTGLGLPWTLIAGITAIQTSTPDHLLGRVAATGNMVMFGPITLAIPLGAALSQLGARPPLLLGAAVVLTAALTATLDRSRPTTATVT